MPDRRLEKVVREVQHAPSPITAASLRDVIEAAKGLMREPSMLDILNRPMLKLEPDHSWMDGVFEEPKFRFVRAEYAVPAVRVPSFLLTAPV